MEFLRTKSAYLRQKRNLSQVIALERSLPSQVFVKPPSRLYVIEFDDLLSSAFLQRGQRVSYRLDSSPIYLCVLSPDPEEYFYKNFSRYPYLRIDTADDPEDVLAALQDDPGGSPADAISFNSTEIAVYCSALRWVAVGCRRIEIALLAPLDEEAERAWRSAYHPRELQGMKAALRTLLPAIFDKGIPKALEDALRKNYVDQ